MINQQVNLLKEIYEEACNQLNGKPFSKFNYTFNNKEGWERYGIYFFDNGKSVLIEDADYKKIANLSQHLHDIMESQTGGDWREFIMYMQDDGDLKTQFNYDIITIMDVINRQA